jgi:hypothetical protein
MIEKELLDFVNKLDFMEELSRTIHLYKMPRE